MKKVIDLISKEVSDAFAAAGYDAELGRAGELPILIIHFVTNIAPYRESLRQSKGEEIR